MTNNVLALKAIRRENELICRKTRITINLNIYYENCIMYNDIVTTIGRGNRAMPVLSAAFDTIDHDNLFYIFEKYVGMCGNALKLIHIFLIVCNVFKLVMYCLTLLI